MTSRNPGSGTNIGWHNSNSQQDKLDRKILINALKKPKIVVGGKLESLEHSLKKSYMKAER